VVTGVGSLRDHPAVAAIMDISDPVAQGLHWDDVTIGRLVDRAATRWPSRPFLKTAEGELSFAEARLRSVEMAGALRALGVQAGERVAILMGNTQVFAAVYLAVARLGAVLVPLHTRYTQQEIVGVLRRSRAETLVMADRLLKLDFTSLVLGACPELSECRPGELRSDALPDLRRVILSGASVRGTIPLSAVAEESAPYEDDDADPNGLAQIKYTSGSTALPKGVMLTHSATIRNAYNLGTRIGLGPDDRVYSGMPFYHAGGSILTMLTGLSLGCCSVVLPRYHAGEALDAIESEQCTAHLGMEIMYLREIDHPDYSWERVSTLRTGWIAGSTEAVTRVFQKMPVPFVNIYGLTEVSGNACTTRVDDPDDIRIGWAGEAQPGLEVAIFDPSSGLRAGVGEVGEIGIRGWAVMEGYLDDAESTRAVIGDDGWLRPGDLGLIDGRGYLKFLGRSKETLKVGGENTSPREVEDCLVGHPRVRIAAVVGVPDEEYGEVPVAFVEAAESGLSAEELLEFCRERLAAFKVPQEIYFVQSHEWTMTGPEKIVKQSLRERALELRRVANG
jgi:acyl-CoA synthetase (AMP-forming)/AMP-acid ligase II